MRLGFKCDSCGTRVRGHGPAAVVGAEASELCASCYDSYVAEGEP